jgi:hypothetical protein
VGERILTGRRELNRSMIALYEVHRGGIPVATLTMPKTTFRLGETVHGVISFNCMAGALQVIKVWPESNILLYVRY